MVGTDRRLSLFDAAARAKEMKKKGEIPEDLDTKVVTETPLTFPNGCHIAEVEVDPQTGRSTLAVLHARWTTAATCSTTPSSRARCTARSPWASARR